MRCARFARLLLRHGGRPGGLLARPLCLLPAPCGKRLGRLTMTRTRCWIGRGALRKMRIGGPSTSGSA
eukprot:2873261-Alexandrium_andersonii.AAC.1